MLPDKVPKDVEGLAGRVDQRIKIPFNRTLPPGSRRRHLGRLGVAHPFHGIQARAGCGA